MNKKCITLVFDWTQSASKLEMIAAVFVLHVGGLDESGNKGGIIDKLSTGRRRFKENFAQRTGREGVDNSEFEERFHRVTELRDKVKTHL